MKQKQKLSVCFAFETLKNEFFLLAEIGCNTADKMNTWGKIWGHVLKQLFHQSSLQNYIR